VSGIRESRDIPHRKSEFLRTRKLGHYKSRNPGEIGTVHQRGRVEEISAIGESPDKESSIGVWVIGISGIPVTKCLCTLVS
jgi:hypothetical protein